MTITRYAVRTITPPGYTHSAAFWDVADSVREGLNDLGVAWTSDQGGTPRFILFGPALLHGDPPTGAILYNLEQVPLSDEVSPWFTPRVMDLFRRFEVWDYSVQNVTRLATHGIRAKHVPVGYHPTLSRIVRAETQDIDALFYGSMNARRAAVLDRLRGHGVKVQHAFGVYGDQRDALIARSKVVLNLHFYPAQVFEIVRCSYLLANRIPVVSEGPAAPGLEAAIAWANYEDVAGCCLGVLLNDGFREEQARRGYDAIRERPVVPHLRAVLGLT